MNRRLLAIALLAAVAAAPRPGDPLDDALRRVQSRIDDPAAKGELWDSIKGVTKPVVVTAKTSLSKGRPLAALQALAAAWPGVEAAAFAASAKNTEAAFEAAWKRDGALKSAAMPQAPLAPAALRGLAEAALMQARVYYGASLDYGRATAPQFGLFYLGTARGARSFVRLAAQLAQPERRPMPRLRSVAPELDALERELLAAYRPPASLERHPEFIAAGAALKEARELDAAGFRFGALVKLMEAARRTGQITKTPLPRGDVSTRLRGLAARVKDGPGDGTIAQMFVEAAENDLDANAAAPSIASAIVTEALPRYFAALAPAPPARAAAEPAEAVVTLVRWPYT
jgi:hypothetical protein